MVGSLASIVSTTEPARMLGKQATSTWRSPWLIDKEMFWGFTKSGHWNSVVECLLCAKPRPQIDYLCCSLAEESTACRIMSSRPVTKAKAAVKKLTVKVVI